MTEVNSRRSKKIKRASKQKSFQHFSARVCVCVRCVCVCVRTLKQKAQSDLQLQLRTGKGLARLATLQNGRSKQKTMTCAYACVCVCSCSWVCVSVWLCVRKDSVCVRQKVGNAFCRVDNAILLLLPFDSRAAWALACFLFHLEQVNFLSWWGNNTCDVKYRVCVWKSTGCL